MGVVVFAVMPTRNRASVLAQSVERALQAPVSKIVVVNNGSSDETERVLNSPGNPRVVVLNQSKNVGCAGGLYIGMRWSVEHGAEAIWILDDDLFVDPDSLAKMLAAEDVCRPVIVRPHLRWRDRNDSSDSARLQAGSGTMPNSVPLMGSLVATAAVRLAGFPNWRFVNGYEDVEYIARSERRGIRVVHAAVDVGSHPVPRYSEIRRLSRTYRREVGPLFRLRTSTRNVLYTTARMEGLSALGLIFRRDVVGALMWSARLYGRDAWRARFAIAGGAISGLLSAPLGLLENRPGEKGPSERRRGVVPSSPQEAASTVRYTMLFPELSEGHLFKDVGVIPRTVGNVCSWRVEVASERDVIGVEEIGVQKTFGPSRTGSLVYLWRSSAQIDVLQVFHLTWRTVVRATVYKVRNRRGVVYVKGDMEATDMERLELRSQRLWWKVLYWIALSPLDIVSVETRDLNSRLLEFARRCGRQNTLKCLLVPNCGFDFDMARRALDRAGDLEQLDLVNIGRLGAHQKGTDVLLEAFRILVEEIGVGARLLLLGPADPAMEGLLSAWQARVKGSTRALVDVRGPVADRAELAAVYASAKVFVLPSRHESGPLTLPEAGSCGCVLVTTRVGQATDILACGAEGKVVPVGDARALADGMAWGLQSKDDSDARIRRMRCFCDNLNWPSAVRSLVEILRAKTDGRQRRTIVGASVGIGDG